MAQNQILQVAVFALLFGTALATLPEAKRAPLVSVLQSLTDTMFRLTRIIMYMRAVAAGAAMAYTVGSMGLPRCLPWPSWSVTYYGALAVFMLLVLVPILLMARIPVRALRRRRRRAGRALASRPPVSEAALPLAMERMEEFGVPRWIVSFVIPTGYSFNMTGSSVYLSMAAIFAAQAAGIHLTLGEQIVMLATLMLTSKGVAGVPRADAGGAHGLGGSFHIPSSRRADAARRRHADGHGPHRHERHRQLHGGRGRRALGRGVADGRELGIGNRV